MYFNEILFEIRRFCFNKVYLKMSLVKCRPFCPGLNVLFDKLELLFGYWEGIEREWFNND